MSNFFILPMYNPGILVGKLPEELLAEVKSVVHHPSARTQKSVKSLLVGSINEEYLTPKIDNLLSFIDEMWHRWVKTFNPRLNVSNYKINPVWTNYMKRGEFNPNHNHAGTMGSFVLWVTIPYDVKEEIQFNDPGNKMATNRNSCFEITYSTIDGRLMHHQIYTDKSTEGTIIMFPPNLIHCVYPFYTSDDERISIAGNITSESQQENIKNLHRNIARD